MKNNLEDNWLVRSDNYYRGFYLETKDPAGKLMTAIDEKEKVQVRKFVEKDIRESIGQKSVLLQNDVRDSARRDSIITWIKYRDSTVNKQQDSFSKNYLELKDSADIYLTKQALDSFNCLLDRMSFSSKFQSDIFYNALRRKGNMFSADVRHQYQSSWRDILAAVQFRAVMLNGLMILLLLCLLYRFSVSAILENGQSREMNSEEEAIEPPNKFARNLLILHIAVLVCVLKEVDEREITSADRFWSFRLGDLIESTSRSNESSRPNSDTSFYVILRDTRTRVESIEQFAIRTEGILQNMKERIDTLPEKTYLEGNVNAMKQHTDELIK